jgi:hypothetical protein
MLGFRSSVECPAPCYLPNGADQDDLAAVIAGTKPSAICPNNPDIVDNEVFQALLKAAAEQGIYIEAYKGYLMMGDRRTVDQLKEVYDCHSGGCKDAKAERCTKLGRLLGYCEEAIHDFVEFGIRRGMTFRERELRRKLIRCS